MFVFSGGNGVKIVPNHTPNGNSQNGLDKQLVQSYAVNNEEEKVL